MTHGSLLTESVFAVAIVATAMVVTLTAMRRRQTFVPQAQSFGKRLRA